MISARFTPFWCNLKDDLWKSGCCNLDSEQKKVLASSNDSLACALINLGAFWSVVAHLPSEKSILPYFSSLSMVAILVCDSHRQAGSMNSPLLDVPIFISKLTLEIMYSRRYYTQIRQHFPHFESDSLCWWRRWDDVCHRS